jgi:hypothetical protein
VSAWALPLRIAVTAGSALIVSACGVPLEGTTAPLANQCTSESDCGATGTCHEGMCVSTLADLPAVLLQVQLPTTAPYGAGSSTLLDPESAGVILQGESPTGYWQAHDLVVPALVHITNARLQVSPVPEGCSTAADGSLPVSVQLQPAEAPVGLPLPIYSGKSSLVGTGLDARYECALEVPAGTYDVFLQVDRGSTEDDPNAGCALPPVLLTGHDLEGDELAINVTVSAPTHLTGVVAGLSWRTATGGRSRRRRPLDGTRSARAPTRALPCRASSPRRPLAALPRRRPCRSSSRSGPSSSATRSSGSPRRPTARRCQRCFGG